MIPSLPRSIAQRLGLNAFVFVFFVFLFVPLALLAIFAFNDAPYPTPPWMGFTLDWFVADNDNRTGVLFDAELIQSLGTSAWVATWVTVLSVGVGTCNAFLLERRFPERWARRDKVNMSMTTPSEPREVRPEGEKRDQIIATLEQALRKPAGP